VSRWVIVGANMLDLVYVDVPKSEGASMMRFLFTLRIFSGWSGMVNGAVMKVTGTNSFRKRFGLFNFLCQFYSQLSL
jgi:hypothetical protein